MLTIATKYLIRAEAQAKKDSKEICGFVLDIDGAQFLYPCKNSSKESNQFKIYEKFIDAAKSLGKILCVYHNHSKGNSFSREDIKESNRHNLPYVIYCNQTDEFIEYTPKSYALAN